jgi:hypothetical protein
MILCLKLALYALQERFTILNRKSAKIVHRHHANPAIMHHQLMRECVQHASKETSLIHQGSSAVMNVAILKFGAGKATNALIVQQVSI